MAAGTPAPRDPNTKRVGSAWSAVGNAYSRAGVVSHAWNGGAPEVGAAYGASSSSPETSVGHS